MSKVYLYFNLLMIAIYAVMSFFLIFAKDIYLLPQPQQQWLGVVILAYTIFRIVALYRKKRIQNEE